MIIFFAHGIVYVALNQLVEKNEVWEVLIDPPGFFSGFLVWLLVNRWALNLPFSGQKRCNHLTCYQVFKNCLGQGCYMISRPLARECSYTHLSRTSNKPKMRLTVSHPKV